MPHKIKSLGFWGLRASPNHTFPMSKSPSSWRWPFGWTRCHTRPSEIFVEKRRKVPGEDHLDVSVRVYIWRGGMEISITFEHLGIYESIDLCVCVCINIIIYIIMSIFQAIDTTNASSYRQVYLLTNSPTLEFLGRFGRIPLNSLCSGHSIPMFIKKTILKLCAPWHCLKFAKKIFETWQPLPPCHPNHWRFSKTLKKDMVDTSSFRTSH